MAQENANRLGFKGAMFPWESAGSGVDETPDRAKDLDGKIIKIHTGQMEHHITADVAYAFYHYYNASQDEKFMRAYGYEVIFETARFWASRVEFNKRKKNYEIKHVIGPDEFHKDVNNNAFTNMMAKWNLLTAYKLFRNLQSNSNFFRKLLRKLELSLKEAREWKRIAARISISMNSKRVIEQFDGYFKKGRVKISNWDENSLPVISAKMTPREYARTQLVKQADVVMLLHLLADAFNFKTKRANYEYYLERTMHKSSLSLPIYALVACEVGDRNRAYRFFHSALHTDISNIHHSTQHGIHAACIGGAWQVLVHGFAGVKIQKGILSLNPRLPGAWRKVLFPLSWRGNLLKFEIKNDRIKIQLFPGKKATKIKIRAFGAAHELKGKRLFEFIRKRPQAKPKEHYL